MDKLLELYAQLNLTKSVEEQIVRELKKLHAPWIIKESVEIEEKPKESGEDLEREVENNIAELQKIDEMLNKAQKIFAKSSESKNAVKAKAQLQTTKPTSTQPSPNLKHKETINDQNKETKEVPVAQKASSLPKRASQIPAKSAYKPVYLSAPYKTQPISQPLKNPRPSSAASRAPSSNSTTLRKATENRAKPKERPPFDLGLPDDDFSEASSNSSEPPVTKIISKPAKNETKEIERVEQKIFVENEFRFELKKNGRELRLTPDLEDMVMQNFKLKQNLLKTIKQMDYFSEKKAKNEISAEQSFMQKVSSGFLHQSSPSFMHYLVSRMSLVLRKSSELIDSLASAIPIHEPTEFNKAKLVKLIQKATQFEAKLNQQLDAIFKQIEEYYNVDENEDLCLFEKKLFSIDAKKDSDAVGSDDLENGFIESSFRNFMPISYKNEAELRKFYEIKCNLIEIKFNRVFLKVFNDFIKYFEEQNVIDGKNIEDFNLLFNIVTNKVTFIVKQ